MADTILVPFIFSPHFPNAAEHLFSSLEVQEVMKALMLPSFYTWKQPLPNENVLKRHGYTPARKITLYSLPVYF